MIPYWIRMRKVRQVADVVIREPFPVVFGRFIKGVKYVGMIHHIDDTLSRTSMHHRWYFNRLKKRLTALDMVVTVSDYWAGYLKGIGCRNVRVIYNAFDPEEYRVSSSLVETFKRKHGIPFDRPVLYIGNASRQKGVHTVYEALKDNGYHFIMSGPDNRASDLPVQYLRLDRNDYITMLHACSVVVCMSAMVEGWNRIAHEALLCKVPVVGNGSGGMMELLLGGKQEIAGNAEVLKVLIDKVISNRDRYADDGYRFVSQFDMNYFQREWQNAVASLLSKGN
jgi:glycosyltransferase involved in cell wall biosynthesis